MNWPAAIQSGLVCLGVLASATLLIAAIYLSATADSKRKAIAFAAIAILWASIFIGAVSGLTK